MNFFVILIIFFFNVRITYKELKINFQKKNRLYCREKTSKIRNDDGDVFFHIINSVSLVSKIGGSNNIFFSDISDEKPKKCLLYDFFFQNLGAEQSFCMPLVFLN